MSAKYEQIINLIGAEFDLDTAGDKIIFSIPHKCVVLRAQLLVTSTDAGGGTVKFDKRPTAGSDTGRGDGDIATLTVPASNQQGKMLFEEPSSALTLVPGDQVVVEVTSDPGAGATMVPMLLVLYVPETTENMTDMVAA